MSSSRFSGWAPRLAIALWIPTAGVLAWSLAGERGSSAPPASSQAASDPRTTIRVTAAEREVVREVMRANVVSLHAVLQAQADGDLAAVARHAREASVTPGPAARMDSLKQKLPPQWRDMGRQVHVTFAAIADRATTEGTAVVTAQLAQNMAACVACHSSFRLVSEDAP